MLCVSNSSTNPLDFHRAKPTGWLILGNTFTSVLFAFVLSPLKKKMLVVPVSYL